MGDFVKGRVPAEFPPELALHLRLHRRLDAYTQQNSSFQTSRRRLDPRFRYGRSVLVDVFYDHFLACQWQSFSADPLEDFAQQVYAGLLACHHLLPAPLQQQLPRMVDDNWLCSYRRPEIVARVLQRLEARLKHRLPLAEGFAELERVGDSLLGDFSDFMPAAKLQVTGWKTTFDNEVKCRAKDEQNGGDK